MAMWETATRRNRRAADTLRRQLLDRSYMDIPESVDVLGVTYRVEIGGCEPYENGFCSPSKLLIGIRDGLNAEKQAQVFLHELVHAILEQLAREEYEDEQLVQGLAIGLHQALFTD